MSHLRSPLLLAGRPPPSPPSPLSLSSCQRQELKVDLSFHQVTGGRKLTRKEGSTTASANLSSLLTCHRSCQLGFLGIKFRELGFVNWGFGDFGVGSWALDARRISGSCDTTTPPGPPSRLRLDRRQRRQRRSTEQG